MKLEEFTPKFFSCLKNYSFDFFKNDLLAGITVGIVAVPLAMAFAIASGLTPEQGLYTAIVAGFLTSLLGGGRLQIGGPTGAFVVVIFGIVQKYGYDGLVVATLLAGTLLLIAAFLRLGSLIKYIPQPVITGFTSGIAVIIFSSQIKDFFGLTMGEVPASFLPKWKALFMAAPTIDYITFIIASGTLALIFCVRRYFSKIPWAIAAVLTATLITSFFHLPVETIMTRFGDIKRTLPPFSWPDLSISLRDLITLFPAAIAIAFLAGIESLLCAVVADSMAGTKHKPNCELMAQGIANIGSVIFGGIPATGAIARTATNIKSGAKTPFAGMIHALTIFLIILAFAPFVSQIPLAALSAVLIMVAWNMSEAANFIRLFKSSKSAMVVLLVTFLLTVLVDLTIGVASGVILATLIRIPSFLRERARVRARDV